MILTAVLNCVCEAQSTSIYLTLMYCCNVQVQIILRSGDTGPYSDPIMHIVRGMLVKFYHGHTYISNSLHGRKRVPPLPMKLYRAYQPTNVLPTSYHKHLFLHMLIGNTSFIHMYPILSTTCMRGKECPSNEAISTYKFATTSYHNYISIFFSSEYREHFFHTHAGCNCLHHHPWISVWLSHVHFVHVETETVQPSSRQVLQLHTRRRQQFKPGNEFKLKFTTSYQYRHQYCLWV